MLGLLESSFSSSSLAFMYSSPSSEMNSSTPKFSKNSLTLATLMLVTPLSS